MKVSRTIEFDAGHRVPDHASKCCNVHGHRYKVEVTVDGDVQPADGRSDGGMVVDFGELKQALTVRVHDLFDHAFIAWIEDVDLINFLQEMGSRVIVMDDVPTAENLAREIGDALTDHLDPLYVESVRVWETPNSCAQWEAGQ